MLPVFNEYRQMLNNFGIDLSEYDEDKLWVDNQIIKGFDKQGNQRKILKLTINDNFDYEFHYYTKVTKKRGTEIIKPKNEELETWEETYKRLENTIKQKEDQSIEQIKKYINKYPNAKLIIATSMGKDSNLVQYLVSKVTNNYRLIFNNTTCDCVDVYKEVKSNPNIKIVNAKDKNGKNLSLYKLIEKNGVPSRHYRWCCSIFKELSIKKYLEEQNDEFIEFLGMRRDESNLRSTYNFEQKDDRFDENKLHKILPILMWEELELWVYTIHNNIHINSKYKKGYSRVGCNIVCPFYKKSSWVLDKYWYNKSFNRFHNILHKEFTENEKWYKLNCTEKEYHLNWNASILREHPTEEVVEEFMNYKNFDRQLAEQYFDKKCSVCGDNVYRKDEVAMNLKLFGENTTNFKCKKCIRKMFNWSKKDWNKMVDNFKSNNCKLF